MVSCCGLRRVLALAIGLSAAGLHAQVPPVRTEVMHFWTAGGEAKAIRVIADAYRARGGVWVDSAVAGGDALRTLALTRLQGGTPPTAMMWTLGTSIEELARKGLLNNLDKAAAAGDWARLVPPSVLERAKVGTVLFAVPIDIHGENWLYSSDKVLKAAGVSPPATWDELIAAGPRIRKAGYIPLALGGQPWQEVLLFRAIVASQGGSDLYRRVFVTHEPAAVRSDGIRQAFDTFARLKPLVDHGSAGRNWNDTTNLLITDKAAFQLMGDWARAEFANAGRVAGRDYQCALPPGRGRGYIIATDAFVFPRTNVPAQVEAQNRLAAVLLDRQVQIDFNRAKGSMPVRNDIPADGFDACGKQALAVLADPGNHLPNGSLSMSDDAEGELEDLITEFWNAAHPVVPDAVNRFAQILAQKR